MKPGPKMISGIILAAGTGSRMGQAKQLLPLGKTTLLGQVLDHARASDLDEIIVVLGHKAERIQNHIDFSGTKLVLNPDFASGQASSLKAGVKAVSQECGGVMFLLGDQPLIQTELINTLIHAWQPSTSKILVPYYKEKRGNPVIIHSSLFQHLLQISGDTGARCLFKKFKSNLETIQINDPAILFDVDEPGDYETLKRDFI